MTTFCEKKNDAQKTDHTMNKREYEVEYVIHGFSFCTVGAVKLLHSTSTSNMQMYCEKSMSLFSSLVFQWDVL